MTLCARWKTRETEKKKNRRRQQVCFATFFLFKIYIIKIHTLVSSLNLECFYFSYIMQIQKMCKSNQQLILTGRRALLPCRSVSASHSGGSSQQRRARAARIQVLEKSPENAPLQQRGHVSSLFFDVALTAAQDRSQLWSNKTHESSRVCTPPPPTVTPHLPSFPK